MRAMVSFASPLAAVVLCATAVRPAAAQQAAPDHARPVVQHTSYTADAAPRTVAAYRFTTPRDAALPAQVTVADSAGALVASYRLPGDRTARPMVVTVLDTDLVLQGETPSGVLTLQLFRQNDAAATDAVGGRWWLGEQKGELRGRAVR